MPSFRLITLLDFTTSLEVGSGKDKIRMRRLKTSYKNKAAK
jgi:hypothetical protein